MKQYFAIKYRDFANTYNLRYAECQEDFDALPENAERITFREAKYLCHLENVRRRDDPVFSGYADNLIYPAAGDFDREYGLRPGLRQKGDGYVVPRTRYCQ